MSIRLPRSVFQLAFVRLLAMPCLFAGVGLLSAHAADDASKPPSPTPPPQLQVLEEGPEIKPDKTPQDIKYVNPNETKIIETRKQGKVTEVQVIQGKSTYYMKPNEQVGTFRGDVQTNEVRGAQFKVFEFFTSKKKPDGDKKARPDPATPDTLAPPPPPTPLPLQ